jgi:hypothetical protein
VKSIEVAMARMVMPSSMVNRIDMPWMGSPAGFSEPSDRVKPYGLVSASSPSMSQSPSSRRKPR